MVLKDRQFILAVDIGTSSVRAALYDHAGKMMPHTLVKNERRLTTTDDGGLEIDAAVATRQLVKIVDAALAAAKDVKGEVTHVAQCSFWHSLVGVDQGGNATTRVLSWADNRSRGEVAKLRTKFDEAEVHNRTGARFHSSFWPAKLLWLRRSAPDVFARTAKWLSLSDYIALKLTDNSAGSVSMASATGLFDIRKCEWDRPLVKFLKLKASSFADIARSSQTFRLNKKFAKRWPRLADAECFPAIGDGAASNIGSGCITRAKAALMVGTSGALRVAYRGTPAKKIPAGLWCYRIDRERVIIGGAISDGGGLFQWLRDNLRLDENVGSAIAKREPGAHGLTFLPFLAGERSTGYHEFATGALVGLRSSTDAVDITQAAMESVAFRLAAIFNELERGANIKEIVASGGALRDSAVWAQMMADVLGRELNLAHSAEASLRGAVLLALETIGKIESIERMSPDRCTVFKPNLKRHAVYEQARKRHQSYYDLIINNK